MCSVWCLIRIENRGDDWRSPNNTDWSNNWLGNMKRFFVCLILTQSILHSLMLLTASEQKRYESTRQYSGWILLKGKQYIATPHNKWLINSMTENRGTKANIFPSKTESFCYDSIHIRLSFCSLCDLFHQKNKEQPWYWAAEGNPWNNVLHSRSHRDKHLNRAIYYQVQMKALRHEKVEFHAFTLTRLLFSAFF